MLTATHTFKCCGLKSGQRERKREKKLCCYFFLLLGPDISFSEAKRIFLPGKTKQVSMTKLVFFK